MLHDLLQSDSFTFIDFIFTPHKYTCGKPLISGLSKALHSSSRRRADLHDSVAIHLHVVELAVKPRVDAHGVVDRVQCWSSSYLPTCRGISPNGVVYLIRAARHVVGADNLPLVRRTGYVPE